MSQDNEVPTPVPQPAQASLDQMERVYKHGTEFAAAMADLTLLANETARGYLTMSEFLNKQAERIAALEEAVIALTPISPPAQQELFQNFDVQ